MARSLDIQLTEQCVDAAGRTWRLETLADRQQFDDPEGRFEALGISPATWSLFGVVWPAGILLADYLADYDVSGLRILETGCGLGLASMVLAARGADVVASDIHPLAGEFLARNTRRNHIPEIPFEVMDWRNRHDVKPFDLIVGSDLLYERGQPELLADFVVAHISRTGVVVLADPGRGQSTRFNRLMRDRGFDVGEVFHGKARIGRYVPSTLSHQGASDTT